MTITELARQELRPTYENITNLFMCDDGVEVRTFENLPNLFDKWADNYEVVSYTTEERENWVEGRRKIRIDKFVVYKVKIQKKEGE